MINPKRYLDNNLPLYIVYLLTGFVNKTKPVFLSYSDDNESEEETAA